MAAARVEHLRRLSGGASRETWSFEAVDDDGGQRSLILQRQRPGGLGSAMTQEARLLRAAADCGVPVAPLVATGPDRIVAEHVEGETIPRRVLRDDGLGPARHRLAAQCGDILARLHGIDPDGFPELQEQDQLSQFRDLLDAMGQPSPAFELAFRWLEDNRPPPLPSTVVHGDFRLGNLIIGPDGVRAVLDWELAHRGDPREDLGWLCAPPWRFGGPAPVAGVGEYGELLAAYRDAGGAEVALSDLRWWEVLATVKWGVMCMVQAATHLSGASRSVELATIGRRVCEVEWDLLGLLDHR